MRNKEERMPSGREGKFRPARSAGIDYFRIAAALLVIAIHIAPFSVWNKNVDFLLTYCFGRVAVPFFFMTTGYFVLAPYVRSGFRKKRSFCRFMVKNTAVYLAVTALYLPLTIYSGNVPKDVFGWIKALVFDGTFYHLWYFPAVLIGCVLLVRIPGVGCFRSWFADAPVRFRAGGTGGHRNFRLCFAGAGQKSVLDFCGRSEGSGRTCAWTAVVCVTIAYVIGLCGDSYYGAIEGVAWMKTVYAGIFRISSYTRNGIFFAPLFLMLGMGIAFMRELYPKRVCVWGLAVSAVFLAGEGLLTYSLKWQRHNSMYICLAPVMFFLFQLLLSFPGEAPAFTRKGSLVLYVIHPAVIVVLRGIAEWLGLTELLVTNTFVQYVSVCGVSLLAAFVFVKEEESYVLQKRPAFRTEWFCCRKK